MEDPFYPPAKERSAARERMRRIARETLPRLLSTPGFREEPDPPTVESLSRIVAPTLILVGERDDRGQPGDCLHLGKLVTPLGQERLLGLRPPGEPRAAG